MGQIRLIFIIAMRSAMQCAVEVQLGVFKMQPLPEGELEVTFRVGGDSTKQTVMVSNVDGAVELGVGLRLKFDSGLDSQRCSIVFHADRKGARQMIGIAPISLLKENNSLRKVYRLTQCEDREASIQLTITTTPINAEGAKLQRVFSDKLKAPSFQRNERMSNDLPISQKERGVLTRKPAKRQEVKVPHVRLQQVYPVTAPVINSIGSQQERIHAAQAEMKRYREEKEAYYQLYQIEKSKNELANVFITALIDKIGKKYPSLVQIITALQGNQSSEPLRTLRKKENNTANTKTEADRTHKQVEQLEQANRSLHRQMDDYRKEVDQLRKQLAQTPLQSPSTPFNFKSRNKGTLLPADLLSELGSPISPIHCNSIPAPAVSRPAMLSSGFCEEDMKRWLSVSMSQRQQLRKLLQSLPARQIQTETSPINLGKLKIGINRALAGLLSQKTLTKQLLLSHKVEMNRLVDELGS